MRLYGRNATRAHGQIKIDLDDGSVALLDVDIDISDEQTEYGVEHHYGDESGLWNFLRTPTRLATSYTLKVPASLRREEAQWHLVVPHPVDPE